MSELNTSLLRAVLDEYATPDPKIVSTINRSGVPLAYVSHADITRILCEVDPLWDWQPIEWIDGAPAMQVVNGQVVMWAKLTLLGKTMIGVGTAKADKVECGKEVVGDFLRNAAMRFGIALSLWSKSDWDSVAINVTSIAPAQERKAEEAKASVQNHPAKGVPSPAVVQQFMDGSRFSDEPSPDEVNEIARMFNATVVENIAPIRPVSTTGGKISDKQKGLISKLAKEKADGDVVPLLQSMFKKAALGDLTSKEGSALIKHLMEMK